MVSEARDGHSCTDTDKLANPEYRHEPSDRGAKWSRRLRNLVRRTLLAGLKMGEF